MSGHSRDAVSPRVISVVVDSQSSYANITCGSVCKTSLSKILTKQNNCVRSMFFASVAEIMLRHITIF